MLRSAIAHHVLPESTLKDRTPQGMEHVWLPSTKFGCRSTSYPAVWDKSDRGNLPKARLLDRLILFLQEKYPDDGYYFWPDLAAECYAHGRIPFLGDACILVIRREEYAGNMLKLRLVQDFWAFLKKEVEEDGCR